ncbi:thiamine phosphate synthase [Agilicoccus flavus]|uniref:thiamine phosphate synthase n=1 Tax=Agilicoccus flavus TaxID=2775968 RepID=UPI001CF643CD|nr:thiamine phosphate synthase [Agilicoccus flavus]
MTGPATPRTRDDAAAQTSARRPGGRPVDPSIYLVTDTALCGEVGVAETARSAVEGGVSLVQLRDPAAGDAELVTLGRDLVAALAGTGVPVVVNDRVDLVAAIGAQGAHVGQGDTPVEEARDILGDEGLLGLSVHTDAELDAALALPPGTIDLLGIGPLRATRSKLDHEPVRGLGHLGHLAARSPWPCVAIGGVGAADAADLRTAGIAGMAVVSAICGRPDPRSAAAALHAAWTAAGRNEPGEVAPSREGPPTPRAAWTPARRSEPRKVTS